MPPHDTERLLSVAQSMLAHLEEAMRCFPRADEEADAARLKPYEKLFGAKNSYVDVLSDLAALILKLQAAQESKAQAQEKEKESSERLNAHDLVLIREFLRRQEASGASNS